MPSVNLFSPVKIGSIQLANRIFMAPLTRTRAGPSHLPNALMTEYYTQRASAGLIVSESSMLLSNTSAFMGEPGLYEPGQLTAWKAVTDAVHAKGSKIFSQIWHAGRAAHPDINGGAESVSASAIAIEGTTHTFTGKVPHAVPRALASDEIPTII
ncbi:hypothetical protein As57867_006567, partial [Aphanomyces stellatus]